MVGGVSLLRPRSPLWRHHSCCPHHLMPRSLLALSSHSPGPSGGFLDPLQVAIAIARAGASLGQSWLEGSRKVSEKMTSKGAKRPAPRSSSMSGRRWERALPARAAVSSPTIAGKSHMSGAISDCYARPPMGRAILGSGGGCGCCELLAPAWTFAAPVYNFLTARERALHCTHATQPSL